MNDHTELRTCWRVSLQLNPSLCLSKDLAYKNIDIKCTTSLLIKKKSKAALNNDLAHITFFF